MAHFQDQCETNSLIPYCSYFLDTPAVLVTTKTGVCCSESRNPTSVEKSSRFCNISGDIFLFTSKVDVNVSKIRHHKPIKLNKYLKYGGHGILM